MVPFSFAGQEWVLSDQRALYWPAERALLFADLHLEKASFFARSGQMLPPYDSRETLERVAQAIRQTAARRVFCLGDNFHDAAGVERLEPHAAGMLDALMRATDWVWITGNHDTDLSPPGGTTVAETAVSGIALRHQAMPGAIGPELSGHFHPRLRVTVRGRTVVRPCFVKASAANAPPDASEAGQDCRLILPSFGALTGGMDASHPAIRDAVRPAERIEALVSSSGRLACFPLHPTQA